MAVSLCCWPAALGTDGGWSKVQSCTGRSTTSPPIGRFFPCSPYFRTAGRRRRGQAGREKPAGRLELSPAQTLRGLISTALPARFGRYRGPGLRSCTEGLIPPDYLPFSGRLPGSYDLQGNNGNMGTSYVKQAENRASGGCAPVPKPSGDLGNMGTEMANPDAGKSARMWLPRAPSSR